MTMSSKTAPKDIPNLAKEGKAKARPTNYTEKVVFDQLNRIERILKDHGSKINELLDRTEDRITGSPAPIKIHITKPGDTVVLSEGLQPGDYTDASKETADALTAMGWGWVGGYCEPDNYIWRSQNIEGDMYMAISVSDKWNHLTPAEFLSRASVTAKELSLVPVEPWVPKENEWVVVKRHPVTEIKGAVVQCSGKSEYHVYAYGIKGSHLFFLLQNARPATEQEIAAHLAEQEAKKPVEFGTRVEYQGDRGFRVVCDNEGKDGWWSLSKPSTGAISVAKRHEFTVID